MEQEIKNKLAEQDAKLDTIYQSVERLRKYFLITMWVTIIAIGLPLVGLVFVIPTFVSTYTNSYDSILE